MILPRIRKALKDQNWLAVSLEFIIVIAGVVIGFQVTQWAENRAESERREIALARLHREMEATVGLLDRMTELYEVQNAARTEAIERLLARDFEGMDEERMIDAITSVSLFPAYAPQQGVYTEIISSGMLSSLGDEAFRDTLGAYQSQALFLQGQIDYLRNGAIGEGRISSFSAVRMQYAPGTPRERRHVIDWQQAAEDDAFIERLLYGNNSMRAMGGWWQETLLAARAVCAETSRLTGTPCNPPERTFE
ncbi:DUF6090 family protein [Maricaulis parjimensis]|uniref:DUF6090 family protein n=1 Tax=Maricaulis parjimensis TaxID=144023 RepID=UPI00193938AD|nr:DUF6090 family protein [Maricaulis parjimensis]